MQYSTIPKPFKIKALQPCGLVLSHCCVLLEFDGNATGNKF